MRGEDTYATYLQSEAWGNKRDHALALAKHRCTACQTKERLQIHHLTYARIFKEEMPDLMVLCAVHHEAAEEMIRKGAISRSGDPAALAIETLRFIAPRPSLRKKKEHVPKFTPASWDRCVPPSAKVKPETKKQRRLRERLSRTSIVDASITKPELQAVLYQIPALNYHFREGTRAGLKKTLREMFRKDSLSSRICPTAFAMFDHCPQFNPRLTPKAAAAAPAPTRVFRSRSYRAARR